MPPEPCFLIRICLWVHFPENVYRTSATHCLPACHLSSLNLNYFIKWAWKAIRAIVIVLELGGLFSSWTTEKEGYWNCSSQLMPHACSTAERFAVTRRLRTYTLMCKIRPVGSVEADQHKPGGNLGGRIHFMYREHASSWIFNLARNLCTYSDVLC